MTAVATYKKQNTSISMDLDGSFKIIGEDIVSDTEIKKMANFEEVEGWELIDNYL